MFKKVLTIISILSVMFMLLGAGSQESVFKSELSVSVAVDGKIIKSSELDGEIYMFLPASADLEKLDIFFEYNGSMLEAVVLSGQNGTNHVKNTLNLKSIAGIDNKNRYVVSAEFENGKRQRIYFMQGDNISTVYLESNNLNQGRTWVDASKNNKASGKMKMVDQKGDDIFDGVLSQIKARGNSTFLYYPKKAYQIKTDSKVDLLNQSEKEKTWVLLAIYNDATLMHDKFYKDLALHLGMNYTPACEWVNVYYDGEYLMTSVTFYYSNSSWKLPLGFVVK